MPHSQEIASSHTPPIIQFLIRGACPHPWGKHPATRPFADDREFRGVQKFTPISRSHPGLVQILHVGRNAKAEYFYVIMEIGDDETRGQDILPASYSPANLSRRLQRLGPLSPRQCVDLFLPLTDALDYLHRQQLIHRDIKPSNIIFVRNIPKFADIGLVTEMASAGRDVTLLGTEGYIAPEGPGTAAADVYSLGKVLYEAVAGLDRTQFPKLPTATPGTPEDQALASALEAIMLKACAEKPENRYPTAAALRADLGKLRTGASFDLFEAPTIP